MKPITIRESLRTSVLMDNGLIVIDQPNEGSVIRLTRIQAQIVANKLLEAINDDSLWEPKQ